MWCLNFVEHVFKQIFLKTHFTYDTALDERGRRLSETPNAKEWCLFVNVSEMSLSSNSLDSYLCV